MKVINHITDTKKTKGDSMQAAIQYFRGKHWDE